MTDYAHVRLESHGHVALATLDRPDKLNALNGGLRDDILRLAQDVRDDDEVRVLVITGAGRGFCSGADLTGGPRPEHELSQNERLDEWGWVGRQALAIHELDKPVIAAVNGVAAGAGMSLALSCDLRVGGPGARFRTVFAERSLSPDSGMSYFLTRILGYARAADLVFTSRDVDATEAYRLGLLDRLIGDGEVVKAALEVAGQIAQLPPLAIRSAKRVLQHNTDAGLRESLRYETAGLAYARKAPQDVRESAASFRERRPPNFTGR
ncbi:MAG TPA: enoyl-CoA hydratase/isomerase family protein [Streptosporangiaceae bacterium]|nr:enoyl-CoA hydratase/isomerase family protein [Streptosporangiaceae bacterium]